MPKDAAETALIHRPTAQHAPAFLCIGAQKAGTDWVYDQFGAHRDFWRPPIKEIRYLHRGVRPPLRAEATRKLHWMSIEHAKGKADHTHEISFLLRLLNGPAWAGVDHLYPYFALFENKPRPGFDCSPQYARLSARQIRSYMGQMPQTKVFVILRDPAERLWSQRLMHERLGRRLGSDFDDHDLEAFARFATHPSVAALSAQSAVVTRWQELLPPERFGVMFFDDLRRNPKRFRDELCAFLGADPNGFACPADENRKSAQPGKRCPPAALQRWMAEHFEQEYEALAALVKGPALDWAARNSERLVTKPVSDKHDRAA